MSNQPDELIQPLEGSLTKTIAQAPGKGWCDTHGCALSDRALNLFGQWINVYDDCPHCAADANLREQEMRKAQAQKDLTDRLIRSGVPVKYADVRIQDFHAHNHAMQEVVTVAERFCLPSTADRVRESLLMLGNVGTGKTMIACAMLRACATISERGTRSTVHYCTASQLLRRIKASWRKEAGESETDIFVKLSQVNVLAIDEIGVQFNSDTERMLLTELINDRYNLEKPTILISNLTLQEFTKVTGERVVDRFKETGRVLIFDWVSQRGNA